MVILWTQPAKKDLKEIHEYISKDSEFYAGKLIDKIEKRTDQLRDFPRSGRIVPELIKDDTIRELIEGNYRIIYKIQVDSIAIIRVLHSARLFGPKTI